MYKDKSILCIIPARSGSKGLKNKNILPLCGKPLISYTIDIAVKSGVFDEVFVSTDSSEYMDIAIKCGASVPFLRSKDISGDSARLMDYVIETLKNYREKRNQSFDYFIILQPTSPIREVFHIIDVVRLLIDERIDSVVSVAEADHMPQLCNKLPESKSMYNFIDSEKVGNRQNFGKYYRLNGSIYGIKTSIYMDLNDFYVKNSKAYIMGKKYSVDIDDEFDFFMCEKIYEEVMMK